MPDIRIETEGTQAKIYVDGKEVGSTAVGYTLTQRARELPTLHLFFNQEDMVDVARIVELEKRVAELEVPIQAQPKDCLISYEDSVALQKIALLKRYRQAATEDEIAIFDQLIDEVETILALKFAIRELGIHSELHKTKEHVD